MSTTPKPEGQWTEGLGELVRAHRVYTGLSQRAFAEKLGMKEKSLSDIEIGRRPTPQGFLDSLESLLGKFDDEVTQVIRAAETQLGADEESTVHFPVDDYDGDGWERCVIGRAAVTSGLIVPILNSAKSSTREAG